MPLLTALSFAVAFSSSAQAAFTFEELSRQAKAQAEFSAVDEAANTTMPPCAGHRAFLEAFQRLAPPASCPRARAYVLKIGEHQAKAGELYERYIRRVDELLRNPPNACAGNAPAGINLREELGPLDQEIKKNYDAMGEGLALSPAEELAVSEGKAAPTGEFSRWECVYLMGKARSIKYGHANIQASLDNFAYQAVESACVENAPALADYEIYVREGQDGVDRLEGDRARGAPIAEQKNPPGR